MVRRAAGKPIRVASKSVRCRAVLREVLGMDGYAGILGYTLGEALWLADEFDDVLVAYPSVERGAFRGLAADAAAAARITLMVDSVEQLDFIDAVVPPQHRPEFRVCIEVDASLRALGGRVHIGPRRSPVHDPADAAELARVLLARPGYRLVGVMGYEGQVAGLGDVVARNPMRSGAIRLIKHRSIPELAERRAAVVAAVSAIAPLEFVNGGGTGSLETTAAESAVTEVAAGSGLYAPGLFDQYRSFRAEPAALFALSVARRPAPGVVTVTGGGWIASGPVGTDRQPVPTYPAGLRLLRGEGAGEVQTPLTGAAADGLRIGDRVWLRHAKAGELCEHLDALHVVEEDRVVDSFPTYRGEGKTFL